MKKQYGRQLEETIDFALKLYPLHSITKEGHEVFNHASDCYYFNHASDCDYFKKEDGT